MLIFCYRFWSIWSSSEEGSQHDQKSLLQLSWYIFTVCFRLFDHHQEDEVIMIRSHYYNCLVTYLQFLFQSDHHQKEKVNMIRSHYYNCLVIYLQSVFQSVYHHQKEEVNMISSHYYSFLGTYLQCLFQSIWPSSGGGSEHDQESVIIVLLHIYSFCFSLFDHHQKDKVNMIRSHYYNCLVIYLQFLFQSDHHQKEEVNMIRSHCYNCLGTYLQFLFQSVWPSSEGQSQHD
jgi:hypothetical protein